MEFTSEQINKLFMPGVVIEFYDEFDFMYCSPHGTRSKSINMSKYALISYLLEDAYKRDGNVYLQFLNKNEIDGYDHGVMDKEFTFSMLQKFNIRKLHSYKDFIFNSYSGRPFQIDSIDVKKEQFNWRTGQNCYNLEQVNARYLDGSTQEFKLSYSIKNNKNYVYPMMLKSDNNIQEIKNIEDIYNSLGG